MSEERYYVPYSVKAPSEATAAFLNITLQHMADFMQAMLSILADKYELSEEDMMKTLFEHPRYKELAVNPMIHAIAAGAQQEAAGAPPSVPSAPSAPSDKEEIPANKSSQTPKVFVKCADGSIKKMKKGGRTKPAGGT